MTVRDPRGRTAAWTLGLTAAALVPVLLLSGGRVLAGEPFAAVLVAVPIVVPAAFVGALLIVRFPRNPIGWVLYVQAAGMGFEEAAIGLAATELSAAIWMAWVASWAWAFGVVGVLVLVPLTFPDGRLPSRRWRPAVWLAAAGVAGFVVGNAFFPQPILTGQANPVAWPAASVVLNVLRAVGGVLVAASVVAAVVSAVQRYRRSRGAERAQMKWFVAGAVLAAVGLVTMAVLYESGYAEAGKVVMGTASAALPVAIALAIFRYRLYEIDRIISRTVSYALLTALLAAVYLGGVLLLAPVLGRGSDLAVAASTLVAAAAFQPLRRRVQAAVDRRFNRARYDAQQEVDQFAERLRTEFQVGDLAEELIGVVSKTVQPESAAVWIRGEGS